MVSEVKWIKIVTGIFDDEKILLIEAMPDGDAILVIWFKLLCLAGKQNNGGVFRLNERMPYTDEMFATVFRRNVTVIRRAFSTFEEFGMIEVIDGTVTIPKWEMHQQLDALEASRKASRERIAKFREKQKTLAASQEPGDSAPADPANCNVTVTDDVTPDVTPCNGDRIRIRNRNIYICSSEVLRGFFDQFWALYPRKVSKSVALKSWMKLHPDEALFATILEDVKRRIDGEWKGTATQYIPHPSTYINQRRWEDETVNTETVVEPVVRDLPVAEIMRRSMG